MNSADLHTTRTTVYPSIEAYNTRSAIPNYVELDTVADDYESTVTIHQATLTIQDGDQSEQHMDQI